MKMLTNRVIASLVSSFLGFVVSARPAFAGPPGTTPIVTVPLFQGENQSARIRSVLRINLETGNTWIVWNLASEGTTISGIVNESANGSWSFPDGTLSVEMLGGGAELWTITPATGPAYSAALLEGTVTQVTGDLVVTAQNMPLSFSTTAAQEFAFLGLQLGLIGRGTPRWALPTGATGRAAVGGKAVQLGHRPGGGGVSMLPHVRIYVKGYSLPQEKSM